MLATCCIAKTPRRRRLYYERAAELSGERRKLEVLGQVYGIQRTATLNAFAARHLVLKAKSEKFTDQWLQNTEQRLRVAIDFFGAETELHAITVRDAQPYAAGRPSSRCGVGIQKKRRENAPGRTNSGQSQRHHLNALSNLYQHAQAESAVPLGQNPIALLMDEPTAAKMEATWLEAHDAALLQEAARTYQPKRDDPAMPFAYPMLATFLLTGGRTSEVLGLEVEDLSFDRRTVTFRPNRHRRLKTLKSDRTVPMWPQLEEVLRAYVFGGEGPATGLLFPSSRAGDPKMLTDVRKMLAAIGERAGWKAGEDPVEDVPTELLRRPAPDHRGEAVSQFTVTRGLGHGGSSLVDRVYGHLGSVRHRADVVEFRVQDHLGNMDGYAERLRELVQ